MSAHHSPMEQFKIVDLLSFNVFGIDVSFTNSSLCVLISICSLAVIYFFGSRKSSSNVFRLSTLQVVSEGIYSFIFSLVSSNVKSKLMVKIFPFVFCIFAFILFSNLFGMLPYSFTSTSHLAVTASLALVVFVVVVSLSIVKNGVIGFFSHFVPAGVPAWLAPVMFVIELFSYLARPCTLSVRLAANMIAGHTVLKVIAGFVSAMSVFGIVPIAFLSALTGFEIFVACLQAYIFSLLTCIYINEALH